MLIRVLARHAVRRGLVLLAVVCVVIGARWLAFSMQDIGTPGPTACSQGHDALWIGHSWVAGTWDAADLDALAEQVRDSGIGDLFAHVGPLDDDGTLDPAKRPDARTFTAAVHRALPGVRVQAWIGDTVPPTGSLDLEDPATRARILAGVRSVLADGFDGVHFDFEPVGDADPGYLALLTQAHALTRQAGAVLSVSAEQVEQVPGSRWAMEALEGHDSWWSTGYLHQVSLRVDQIAVMSYDTALWSSSAYTGFVRDETATALAAVPPGVALFLGVPAYRAGNLGHVDAAETVAAAVRGVRLALPDGIAAGRSVGVALYVDFAATPADWNAYRADWLDPCRATADRVRPAAVSRTSAGAP